MIEQGATIHSPGGHPLGPVRRWQKGPELAVTYVNHAPLNGAKEHIFLLSILHSRIG